MRHASRNEVAEWSYSSSRHYTNPFNDVELDVVFTDPTGSEQVVPTFWAGGDVWGVRFRPSSEGTYRFRTVCTDTTNSDLHRQEGELSVGPSVTTNTLLQHGALRVSKDRRHLEHRDGTPFFWLGDTWWMGLCRRLKWPEDFRQLTADRVAKGFTVIQIVAGLYPDMEPFDERGMNEAGYPWEKDFSRINPDYFEMADIRIAYLVREGLVPCIVGSWGYFMEAAGFDVLKKHWRNLIARYSAYPVVWCAAGEALMDYYLNPVDPADAEAHRNELRRKWGDLVRYMRATDPCGHPITIHPTRLGHDQVDDPSILDLDMLQTGHGGFSSLAPTVNILTASLSAQPNLPVLVGEVNYEGIMESSREEVQRFIFWSCMLSGAAGHTYGANGLWQVNGKDIPYGLSPHGTSWGDIPWDAASQLPGSGQLGLAKRLMEKYEWWRFEPHPEWIDPANTAEDRLLPYPAGIPGKVRMIFIPAGGSWTAWGGKMAVKGIEPGAHYQVSYVSPKDGKVYPLGEAQPSPTGDYLVPKPPVFQDWILVLDNACGA